MYVERPLQFFVVHLSHYQSHYNFMAGYRRKYSGFNKDFLSIVIRCIYTSISPYNDQPQRYEGPAKSFVTGFGLLQCYILSNIFLVQTFKVFPLY